MYLMEMSEPTIIIEPSTSKRLQENEATCKAILSLVKKSQKKNIDQYKVGHTRGPGALFLKFGGHIWAKGP